MNLSNFGAIRHSLLSAAVLAFLAASASAQMVEKERTFADLTASHPCSSGYTGRNAIVTDCDAADDIGDGGGAFRCFAHCDGTAPWEAVSIGGGAGGGVSGLDTADGGTALSDNALVRGDGTTGIQGSTVTVADSTGNLQWEGTTADAFEGNFTFADPTADWTWNWTAAGILQGAYVELAAGTGANFYADSGVSLTVNRGGSGFPFAVYNSDDGVFGVENQGSASGKVTLGSGVPFGWNSNATISEQDTSLSRDAADVVKVDSMLELTPIASGGTCDAAAEGRIYNDDSHALCWCDGTTANKLSGAGTCD